VFGEGIPILYLQLFELGLEGDYSATALLLFEGQLVGQGFGLALEGF
jgi:hypothetical protein